MNKNSVDFNWAGVRVGSLTVLGLHSIDSGTGIELRRDLRRWSCRCDCGAEVVRSNTCLRSSKLINSCGAWRCQAAPMACGQCGKSFLCRNKKPSQDGIKRCKSCRFKYSSAQYKLKNGESWAKKQYRTSHEYRSRRRSERLKYAYGISVKDYETLLEAQGGVCAICKKNPGGKNFHVDHDHRPGGRVRGILCGTCNPAIGMLYENTSLLHSAIGYILRHSERRSWDQYFSDIASLVATRSKDKSSQVGAVLVRDRVILSTGYNGFPRGIDDSIPERNERPVKYSYTVHAEENAMLNAGREGIKVEGSTLYVTPFSPCVRCANAIIQCGVKEVVINQVVDNPRWADEFKLARALFDEVGVKVRVIGQAVLEPSMAGESK